MFFFLIPLVFDDFFPLRTKNITNAVATTNSEATDATTGTTILFLGCPLSLDLFTHDPSVHRSLVLPSILWIFFYYKCYSIYGRD